MKMLHVQRDVFITSQCIIIVETRHVHPARGESSTKRKYDVRLRPDVIDGCRQREIHHRGLVSTTWKLYSASITCKQYESFVGTVSNRLNLFTTKGPRSF